MIETRLAANGRARHWIVDAFLGGTLALGAITLAHAARPELLSARPAPVEVERVVLTAAPAPQEPPVLIAFNDPVPGREVVSPFGLRKLPWEEGGRLHAGVDISANPGEPVLAAADGVVTEAGQSSTYGRYAILRHAEGLTTLYAHMGALERHLRPGLALEAGAPVGKVGSSGTSTGPHLHFEIRDARDRPLNPTLFLGQSFAEAEDLPLRKAQRFGRHVRIAHVSTIPRSKRALMEAKAERKAAEKALLVAEKDPTRSANSAEASAKAASAVEKIDGIQGLTVGEDGRPRAQLTL